ncbi:MAG: hypothetical protein GY679_02145 [Mycoplasma sp.]|nr:hypothetical protein [Mycoplasma sp.]
MVDEILGIKVDKEREEEFYNNIVTLIEEEVNEFVHEDYIVYRYGDFIYCYDWVGNIQGRMTIERAKTLKEKGWRNEDWLYL